ncbi:uncharacterized protein UV8b_00291 [Ustilaginoidea virens]|uniref:LIM zinc-binding domain-containing protein n=1 Tax=Ustilaginoidea virens TaxID=1159556 RepID=A0A8E5HIS6_USTVR|nr:uncharacterized protein UV8b_00291 [Ustilaginoidea virens]QUC16050.1 hypothetical protein UV8b_00291 [Ustilaginoidea virens]
MMGDHVCSGKPAELSPPLDASDDFESLLGKRDYPLHGPTRPATGSADHSYLQSGQLTPVSQPSESRNGSPVYPARNASPRVTGEASEPRLAQEPTWDAPKPKSAALPNRSAGHHLHGGDTETDPLEKPASNEPLTNRPGSTCPGLFHSQRRPSDSNARLQRTASPKHSARPSHQQDTRRLPSGDGNQDFAAPRNASSGSLGCPESFSSPPPRTAHPTSASEYLPGPSGAGNGIGHSRKNSKGPDTSRRPPPRTSLLLRSKCKGTGSVDLAAEFGAANPYHVSSDSASSGYSDFSMSSQTTSRTSPSRSQTHDSNHGGEREGARPSAAKSKPKHLRIDAAAAAPPRFAHQMVESPFSASPQDHLGASARSRRDAKSSGGRSSSPRYPEASPAGHEHAVERQGSRDALPAPTRGDCKACGIAITGKSISSADGRLSGKYHKACFVCSTCHEPFSSSVFYVLEDRPYCEHHYHKLNNSICGSCNRGIEGQFAEDETQVKHHVGCFRCLDCRVSLTDGYFEVGGSAYCERDAWKRIQSPRHAEQETHDQNRHPTPARGGSGPRVPNGLSARPGPRPGQGVRPCPPPANGLPSGGRMTGGAHPRFRMNKRMTRLGNINS